MIYKNLVFAGGGVKGIAYLGVLNTFHQKGIINHVQRVAGTSAGAISATLTAFNLPFSEVKHYADSLNYRKVPQKKSHYLEPLVEATLIDEFLPKKEDLHCILRLLTDFGWYSSEYFYTWLQAVIAEQFDYSKKKPPYTFEDFKQVDLHRNNREFLDLYIVGTDMTSQATRVFSYETTPTMEVAKAVRISMSIPLFFESIPIEDPLDEPSKWHLYADGGVIRNFPINIFDNTAYGGIYNDEGINLETIGIKFNEEQVDKPIYHLIDYIQNLIATYRRTQKELFRVNENEQIRTITIDATKVNSTDFNITPGDSTYNYLYLQGKLAAEQFNYATV